MGKPLRKLRRYHRHRCEGCGYVWRHTAARKGDAVAHTCRRCGRLTWTIDRRVGGA